MDHLLSASVVVMGRSSRALATAVSEKGVVVGASGTPNDSTHAFVWTEKGGMVDLGTLPVFSNSYATEISKNAFVIQRLLGVLIE